MRDPLFLPVVRGASPPSIEEARTRLGGRVSTEPEVGVRVRVGSGPDGVEGIVVCAFEGERDVWLGDGRIRRAPSSACSPALGEWSGALSPVALAAIRFASLREGDVVRYVDRSGHAHRGTLVEKCRYGGLVRAADGTIVAAGFQAMGPRE